MFIVDSNILVSEILTKYEKDELTLKYQAFYKQIPLIKRVISDFILNEFELYMVQVVPSRYQDQMSKQERKVIREVTSTYMEYMIGKCTLISPSISTIKTAFDFYKRFGHTHYISFTDSLLLATAKDNGYTILTKDRRLNLRAKDLRIDCYEP
jgi:predicted nucleic acid-binding protein